MMLRAASTLLRRGQQAQQLVQLTRGLATSASTKAASAEIKLPIAPLQLSGTSASIATLTWQVAAKEGVLDKVQDEISQFAEAIKTLPELRRMAADPFIPTIVRKKIIESVLAGSGATEVTKRLFSSLAEENILAATFEIAEAFEQLQLAHKKEVYVTIITAQPLDKLERIELRKNAEQFVEPGFKLVAKEKIDKKLLGGFILEFEDRLVDMSQSKKLEEYNNLVNKLERDLLA